MPDADPFLLEKVRLKAIMSLSHTLDKDRERRHSFRQEDIIGIVWWPWSGMHNVGMVYIYHRVFNISPGVE